MVQFRNQEKEVVFKIVYYGPALSGKTTNIETLHEITDPDGITKVTSLKTSEDRTLFFDLLPFDLGEIQGYHIRIQVYTVPGQVHYNATRKIVLSGADSVVFVADSQDNQLEENYMSWENMKANLLENHMKIDEIPVIIQCNKIDLENSVSSEKVLGKMRVDGQRHVIESSAIDGEGVIDTFRMAVAESLAVFSGKFRMVQKGITREKINESLMKFFEPFEKKRMAAREIGNGAVEIKVPLTGLSEEQQLSAALKAATELAEQHNEIERLSRLGEERLREMTLLYDIGVSIASFKNNDSLALSALRLFSQLKPSWIFSLFGSSKGTVELLGCFGADRDPLFDLGIAQARDIAIALASGKEPARLKDLPGRIEVATGNIAAVPESVTTVLLGDASAPRYAVLVYASSEETEGDEMERVMALFEKLVSPRIVANALSDELAEANEMLERRVIEKTADISRALDGLKDLDEVKHAFVDTASGEMGTPLARIRSCSDYLLRHPDKWFDKGTEYLTTISQESEKLENLATHLFSFSKVKEPFTGNPCDLAAVLDSVLRGLAPRLKAKKVQAVVKKDSEPLLFPINEDDATVLMRQLIDNAIKYTPEGTSVKVFLMEDEKRIVFSVRDFGEGFSKDCPTDKTVSPSPGQQSPPSLKNGGMGLFLVKEVLVKYRGTMHIDQVEPGTIILIELPKA